MSFSYDPTALATSELYQVRLEIRDTDSDNARLQDEEIERAIAVESDFWGAAARCCELISRDFLMKADVRLGRDLQLAYTTTAKQYTEMAAELRQRSLGSVLPYVGGRSKSEKISRAQDTDAVQPIFTKEMESNPYVGGYTSDSLLREPGDEDESQ